MGIAKSVMQSFYRKAEGKPERLPWHRESPSRVLVSAVAACARPARALDLGCGAGVLTLWLAEKGLEVTGIDILPEAITMARSLAEQRRAEIEFLDSPCREARSVLEHWGKRHALDWRPIGPRRRTQTTIERMFAPELQLIETDVTDFAAPLPFGPTVRASGTGSVAAVGDRWAR